jgi:hypothetical protein
MRRPWKFGLILKKSIGKPPAEFAVARFVIAKKVDWASTEKGGTSSRPSV